MCVSACVCKHDGIYIFEASFLDANQVTTKLSEDTVTRQPVLAL